ncbi:hypothetical protein KY309_02250 [Candidatus Woesearchaeota archaeon]|nr:hypothetical protein [Candidatus Woesearchaeota archaeon]MBW3016408.1 hypothetical protein [Candidatus Woesearchaeota archaeon]
MNGLLLCCRFSDVTNRLNYCGPLRAFEVFERFIKTGEGEREVRDLLSRFESVFPYLQLIARKHNLSPFDERVVEAYWLGNELLDAFTVDDFREFLVELGTRGLPSDIVKKLQDKVPVGALPCHAFHVLFVGVGRVTGKVPTNQDNMTKCLISSGEVVEVLGPAEVSVRRLSLTPCDGGWCLAPADVAVVYNPEFLKPVVGDVVAVHWNHAVHVIDKMQAENVKVYTQKAIDAVNSVFQ